ncbi:MAG: glycine cleavage system aminomethyltransferase GcvT [Planctomycetota bacterium]|nr:glycine cleavage system aminomethyltransferase GcvT [Planctomycetota bacterium]
MSDFLKRTVFHDWHVAHNGRMVEFGGWDMPVQYSTIVEEHNAVRNKAGLFDIAHMGRLEFTGPEACRFLDWILTNDVTKLEVGQVRYSLVTNEQGGVLDDVLVYRFPNRYMLVVNASNREKIVSWITQHLGGFDVRFKDLTLTHAMLAIQGPLATRVMAALDCGVADSLGYYSVTDSEVLDEPAVVSRTGYTGEDGFEIIVANEIAGSLWHRVVEAGEPIGLQAAGLGCRDTLRLEAAMPLYGHELNEDTDPITAGLNFAVKLKAADFIGRSALRTVQLIGRKKTRIGIELTGRRIAREGAAILSGGSTIGEVTSGTFSPTLEKPIGMAYVENDFAKIGTPLEVDIRGKREAATVVALPFYKRATT